LSPAGRAVRARRTGPGGPAGAPALADRPGRAGRRACYPPPWPTG